MGQVADFVQEQRALVGTFDLTDGLLHRAGECAALVAEQLTFQQVFRDSAAVDRNERLFRARAKVVHRARQGFLAGAALAKQQNRNVGGGNPFDVAANLQHARIAGYDPFDGGAFGNRSQAAILILQPMQVQAALNDRP